MDFDNVLDEIGEFGKYQKIKYYLLCLPVFFGAANSLSYVFTAGRQPYRCFVPECETTIESSRYHATWMQNAVPGTYQLDETFIVNHCKRFVPALNATTRNFGEACSSQMFSNETEKCDQYVFDTSSHTIVQEWMITCEENEWKLAFVGTAHFAGVIVGSVWMAFGDQ